MTIQLITEEEHELLLRIQKEHPVLTFKNKGFEYIDKSSFSEADKEAYNKVNELLRKSVQGFQVFNNFCHTKTGELRLRFQYAWASNFTGVGYILADELLNGFSDASK